MKKLVLIAAALIASPAAVIAANHTGHGAHAGHSAAPAAQAALADGEVRKVDKSAKKITIKHGELKSLGMPPMTMVFQVRDVALLDQVKAGDKVQFAAEESGGTLIVTAIKPAR